MKQAKRSGEVNVRAGMVLMNSSEHAAAAQKGRRDFAFRTINGVDPEARRADELHASEALDVAEVDVGKHTFLDQGVTEIRAVEIGVDEMGLKNPGVAQVRAAEIRAHKPRGGHDRAA